MTFPWEEADDPVATAVETTGQPLPVAWWGRTSTDDQQDPTLSLPRQLRGCRDALPGGYVIVAHFYDVESGRLDLDDRGKGTAHERFNIPIPRDGGIQDLLAEAKRPDRRFAAVMCESVERVARRTYFGAKVEYELEQAGVMLLAADEPLPDLTARRGGRAQKRATPILTRRVKQAIAEFYVLQMLELSWDGTAEHTEQGWNIGKPCYGYRAEKVPHPVAAKRAEGRTKSRLIPHPVEGPTVTRIFFLRATCRLSFRAIADILNDDPEAHPPPTPITPRRALRRWSTSAVREILNNPKYTGYMVWNRRATSSRKGQRNEPDQWVWSPHPTHEPLVTKEQFQTAGTVRGYRKGSRSGSAANPHPETKRTYLLRSFVFCQICGRRMQCKTSRGRYYYACQPDRHHHPDRRDWYDSHPKALWVREGDLVDLTHRFFTDHVLGPHRHEALRTPLGEQTETKPDPATERLQAELADLHRRIRNVLSQLEDVEPTGDDEIDRDLRSELRHRYAELARQQKAKAAELAQHDAPKPREPEDDPTILDHLPTMLPVDLADIPETLQRDLYNAFNLELHYDANEHVVTIRATVRAGAIPNIQTSLIRTAEPDTVPEDDRNMGRDMGSAAHVPAVRTPAHRITPGSGSLVSSTPNGIRTRVATLRGWCPRPLDDGGLKADRQDTPATQAGPTPLSQSQQRQNGWPAGSRYTRQLESSSSPGCTSCRDAPRARTSCSAWSTSSTVTSMWNCWPWSPVGHVGGR